MKYVKFSRIVAILLALLTCSGGLLALPAYAADENSENNQSDEEYEAKKAAYREKIKSDDITTDDFLIGSWVSFYSFDIHNFEYQLDQMAEAGINFNIFPKNFGAGYMFDAAYWEDVEAQYAKRNMVYLMNGDMYEKNIAPGVEYAQGKEHCIGYHVVDEPWDNALEWVAYISQKYRELDHTRYPFTNLYPSYAAGDRLGGTYYEYISKYVELTGPENIEYLSHDYYPFPASGTIHSGIFADMEVVRKVAYENGKLKTHAFPQSTAWTGMRMPNATEMRWNVYAYLAYGFKALSWFNLVCPGSSDSEGEGFHDSLIYRDGTIRDPELFAAWSDLNWEIRGLSDILMNQDVSHAYHVHKTTKGVEYLPEDFFLIPKGKNDFIVSVMEPKEGEDRYIMLFNKNIERSTTCHFAKDASAEVKWLEYFDPQIGEYIPIEFKDGMFEDDFLPGEGRLYRLRYDNPPSETEKPTEITSEVTTESATESATEMPTEITTEVATETKTESADTESTEKQTASTAETEESDKGGCGSTISVGAVVLSAAAAAIVASKRKRK